MDTSAMSRAAMPLSDDRIEEDFLDAPELDKQRAIGDVEAQDGEPKAGRACPVEVCIVAGCACAVGHSRLLVPMIWGVEERGAGADGDADSDQREQDGLRRPDGRVRTMAKGPHDTAARNEHRRA
eukprot:6110959-Prymnesium_polylepis.1